MAKSKNEIAKSKENETADEYPIPDGLPDLPMIAHEKIANAFRTPAFRVSYPSVFRVKKDDDKPESEWQYEITALIPNQMLERWKPLRSRAIQMVKESNWPDVDKARVIDLIKTGGPKGVVRDGSTKNDESYQGCWYLTARSKMRPEVVERYAKPQVINGQKTNVPPIIEVESDFYGGCWARMTVRLFLYGGKGKVQRGVGVGVLGIQKLLDDTPFGSRINAQQEFDDEYQEEAPTANLENDEVDLDAGKTDSVKSAKKSPPQATTDDEDF